jgi:hypothetical protein
MQPILGVTHLPIDTVLNDIVSQFFLEHPSEHDGLHHFPGPSGAAEMGLTPATLHALLVWARRKHYIDPAAAAGFIDRVAAFAAQLSQLEQRARYLEKYAPPGHQPDARRQRLRQEPPAQGEG